MRGRNTNYVSSTLTRARLSQLLVLKYANLLGRESKTRVFRSPADYFDHPTTQASAHAHFLVVLLYYNTSRWSIRSIAYVNIDERSINYQSADAYLSEAIPLNVRAFGLCIPHFYHIVVHCLTARAHYLAYNYLADTSILRKCVSPVFLILRLICDLIQNAN